jgi:hypothetical protein
MLMTLKTKIWFKALIAAIVTGGSSSGLSALGIATASGLGVNVPKIDVKQFLIMLGSGALIGALAYLKQSPVPPASTGNTEIVEKKDVVGLP